MTIWVVGEVLVDLIPDGSGNRQGVIGGGSANTAKALARLGHQVEFIDGISNDQWGQKAKSELISDSVGLNFVNYSDKPTCQAIVSLADDGSASYEFIIDGTATFDFQGWLPKAQKYKPQLLQIGTLVTVIEPSASILHDWALELSEFAPIVFDPNVRSAVISDRNTYVSQVEKWVEIAAVVKASDEDLAWLYPGQDLITVAKKWLELGPQIIVVTKGKDGLMAVTTDEVIEVPGVKVEVVDTIGAGDTVGAIVCETIIQNGLDKLSGEILRSMLKRAAIAAAITCTRKGPIPPTAKELADAIY